MISIVSEGVVSWATAEVLTIPRSTKKKGPLICKPSTLEHEASVIRKELEVEQIALFVSSEESTSALNEFETVDLKLRSWLVIHR